METVRVILKVPFHQHPAGSVFELTAETDVAGWDADDRVREKQSFADKAIYRLPDGGRGYAVELSLQDTRTCPDHLFEGKDLYQGECRVTRVFTCHENSAENPAKTSPCGLLAENHVTVQKDEKLRSQRFCIDLPPFEAVAEKMVLYDRVRQRVVMQYELRNYRATDTRLNWDVSDLYPGFFDLFVNFPDGWKHTVRFIKPFPFLVDPSQIPPAPEKAWQKAARAVLQKFDEPPANSTTADLRNAALELCLEWGENFNKPTQDRLMARFRIATSEADDLDRLAREVRSFVYGLCQEEMEGKLNEGDIHFEAKRKYPWVSSANFNRMKNVGMYYARR